MYRITVDVIDIQHPDRIDIELPAIPRVGEMINIDDRTYTVIAVIYNSNSAEPDTWVQVRKSARQMVLGCTH